MKLAVTVSPETTTLDIAEFIEISTAAFLISKLSLELPVDIKVGPQGSVPQITPALFSTYVK